MALRAPREAVIVRGAGRHDKAGDPGFGEVRAESRLPGPPLLRTRKVRHVRLEFMAQSDYHSDMHRQRHEIEALAQDLLAGRLSLDAFVEGLGQPGTADLGDVTLDLDRPRRCGFPEVVYGSGKPAETLIKIVHQLLKDCMTVLITRVDSQKGERLMAEFPAGSYNVVGQTFRLLPSTEPAATVGRVTLVTAGTSDLPVAEEARETLDWMGVAVTVIHDVGVAGPHRLPMHLDKLRGADAVVVVAGLEGALPSVVGGHVDCPVIAVPTSVGYGASFGGVAALLGMLNSCAANVTVVNIDAGFKGGYVAGLIARRRRETRPV
ncbi:MAG: nickel pincer cofactor biosynthesis protein LarB [Pirellulaceae bacterium]